MTKYFRVYFLLIVLSISVFQLVAQDEKFKIYEDSFDIRSVQIGQYLFNSPMDISYLNLDTFTSFDHLHEIERRSTQPMIGIGNQGSPLRYFNWQTPTNLDLEIGIHGFNPYYFQTSNIQLYKVDRPFTELVVSQGKAFNNSNRSLQNNMTLDGIFSRNLDYDMNLFITYRKLKEAGAFAKDENEVTAFQTGLIRTNKDSLRWNSALIYTFNEIERKENGGIAAHDSLFLEELHNTRSSLEIMLQDASTRYTSYNLQFKNRYNIINGAFNRIAIGHEISFEKSGYKYFDAITNTKNDSLYYQDFLVSSQGLRSLVNRDYLKNDIRIAWRNKYINELALGGKFIQYKKSWDSPIEEENESYVYGVMTASVKFITTQNKIDFGLQKTNNTFQLKSNTNLYYNKLGTINININISSKRPDLLYNRLDVTQYNIWDNKWDNEQNSQFKLTYISPKNFGSIGIIHNKISHQMYFDKYSRPLQSQEPVVFQEYFLHSNFLYKSIGVNNHLYYRSKEKIDFIYTPQFHTIHELYYTHKVFNDQTILRTGIEGRYYYRYTLPRYNSLIGNFYPGEADSGFRMLLDYYINLRLPQFKIFVKATNIMDIFQHQQYKWAENYPLHDWTVRFGIKWTYFD